MNSTMPNDEAPYDEETLAVADAFWLEPENAEEGMARLTQLGYRVVPLQD